MLDIVFHWHAHKLHSKSHPLHVMQPGFDCGIQDNVSRPFCMLKQFHVALVKAVVGFVIQVWRIYSLVDAQHL